MARLETMLCACVLLTTACGESSGAKSPNVVAGAGGDSGAGNIAGASNSAGTGGSDIPPPVKVNDCSKLPAPGVWETITPPLTAADSGPQAIQVDPLHAGAIYVQIHTGGNGSHAPTDGLRESDDCGSTWKPVQLGRNASDSSPVNISKGSWTSLIIDPVDSQVMYTVSNYGPGGVWKSLNGGVDWDQVVPDDPGKYVNGLWFNGLSIDPGNHKHLIAANHDGCTGPFTPNCLAETHDAGATWNLIKLPIDWAEGNGAYIIDDTTLLFATNEGGLYLTKNGGKDWANVFKGASGAGLGTSPYLASDGSYYLATAYGLVSSPATDLANWTTVQDGQFLQILGTGKNMIAANWFVPTFWTASESAPAVWTQAASPMPNSKGSMGFGAVYMVYDKAHHLVIASNYYELFRMVLE